MATATELRRVNQRKILESMLRLRRASRTVLAREAGMSQPTVSRIVDHLLSQGILTEVAWEHRENENGAVQTERGSPDASLARASAGRPSTPLELDRSKPRFLAIQLGVVRTRLAALPVGIDEEDHWDVDFATPASAGEWESMLLSVLPRVLPQSVDAVVMTMPGVLDEQSGRVMLSPNLRWAEQADFSAILRRNIRAPIHFLQEIRALALGHMAMSRDPGDFLLVDFGSGVGAAAVLDSRLYTGSLLLSGELGHTPQMDNGRRCGCGGIGCIETRISRPGLLASAVEHGLTPDWDVFLKWLETQGMPDWLARDMEAAAYVIAGALNVLGLKQVVMTGYVNQLPAMVKNHLAHTIQRGAMWTRFGQVTSLYTRRHRLAGMVCTAMQKTY